jgi:hypothetical protein
MAGLACEIRKTSCAGQDAQDFLFTHDDEIFTIQLDFGAGVLAEQDAVALFHCQGKHLAFIVALAFADGDYFALLRLFFGAVGDDDATTGGLTFFNPPNQQAVV